MTPDHHSLDHTAALDVAGFADDDSTILMAVDDQPDRIEVVYVPRRPGPLVSLNVAPKQADEIDEVLDDLFGAADDRGPSSTDAFLIAAGVVVLSLIHI